MTMYTGAMGLQVTCMWREAGARRSVRAVDVGCYLHAVLQILLLQVAILPHLLCREELLLLAHLQRATAPGGENVTRCDMCFICGCTLLGYVSVGCVGLAWVGMAWHGRVSCKLEEVRHAM